STTSNIVVRVNAAPAITLTLSSPTAATVGTAYTGTIGVSGGTAPYSCSLTSGSLPAGITQNNCTLTGVASASGTFALGIKATDSSSPANSGSATLSLVVNAAASVQLSLSSPTAATVGTAYTGTIGVSGGTGPYTCSLASGTVPAGLTLNGCT
ncbi:putative Ig domain-containing protein, partial [Terriglobus sp. ADX1]|uniref:putative Ig domain-containing protein n=1 Tax=Terriglobus sp. ADX1 TaxID=2794063 RepID=UPI002FE67B2A